MQSRLPIACPPGYELRQSSGALEAPATSSALESRNRLPNSQTLPPISSPLLRWFTWYSRRYLRRHFHSLRVSRAGLPPHIAGRPLVIYSNHASWWDALVWAVARENGVGLIYTEGMPGAAEIEGVRYVNPFA